MKKILFADIDGTLLSDKSEIDERVRQKINCEKEIKIVLATGRSYNDVRSLDLHVDAILSGGSEIYNYNSKERHFVGTLDLETIERIANFCRANNLTVLYTTDNGNIIESTVPIINTVSELAQIESTDPDTIIKDINIYYDIIFRNSRRVEDIGSYLRNENIDIIKVEIFTAKKKSEYMNEISKIIPDTTITASHISNIEILSKNINKASCIKMYLKNEPLPYRVYVIGDEINDLEMFEFSDVSFAVANAHQKLLRVADYVVSSVDQQGIFEAIEQIKGDCL